MSNVNTKSLKELDRWIVHGGQYTQSPYGEFVFAKDIDALVKDAEKPHDFSATNEIRDLLQAGLDEIVKLNAGIHNKNMEDAALIKHIEEAFKLIRRSKEFFAAYVASTR